MKNTLKFLLVLTLIANYSCKSTDNPISGMPIQKIYLDDLSNNFIVIKVNRNASTTLPAFRYTTESKYGFAILNLNEKYEISDTIVLKIKK